jgi:hypothetical protein
MVAIGVWWVVHCSKFVLGDLPTIGHTVSNIAGDTTTVTGAHYCPSIEFAFIYQEAYWNSTSSLSLLSVIHSSIIQPSLSARS